MKYEGKIKNDLRFHSEKENPKTISTSKTNFLNHHQLFTLSWRVQIFLFNRNFDNAKHKLSYK